MRGASNFLWSLRAKSLLAFHLKKKRVKNKFNSKILIEHFFKRVDWPINSCQSNSLIDQSDSLNMGGSNHFPIQEGVVLMSSFHWIWGIQSFSHTGRGGVNVTFLLNMGDPIMFPNRKGVVLMSPFHYMWGDPIIFPNRKWVVLMSPFHYMWGIQSFSQTGGRGWC